MKSSIFSFLVLGIFVLSSCEKGNIVKETDSKDLIEWKDDTEGKEDKTACFELVYPVTFLMPDGSALTGNEEEVWGAIKAWYEANPDSEEKPALQYPVDVIYKEEITKAINNEEEMIWAKKDCEDKEWDKEECFGLVYPVTFLMPDGSALTGNEEEVWGAIKAWYEANPDSEEKPALQYPVEIAFEDGTIQAINDEAAMAAAKEDCGDER